MIKTINFRLVLSVISKILIIISISLLLNGLLCLYFKEPISPFLISALIALFMSVSIHFVSKKARGGSDLKKKDAYLTVTLSWIIICLIGSLPYLFSKAIPNVENAIFESVSGFTTTGSSILTDIESLPYSILFWRSLTHWIGGIGIIVLVIIIMPSMQIGSYRLFSLESSLQEKIHPKTKQVGISLMLIYVFLTFSEVIFLLLGKMPLFESVCHAFGTIATGGFSPRNTSITEYSPYIQYVIMVFMCLAGTNFVIHYYILKRNFKKIYANEELKFYGLIIFIVGGIVTISLYFKLGMPFEESFRTAFFQVISIITTTGFATSDYLLWPIGCITVMFLILFLGGSTGSTAGGIKMIRHLVLFKNIGANFRKIISPNAIIPVRLNNQTIDVETNNTILSFITLYIMIVIVSSIVLILTGVDGKTATSSVATCMAGIGPGIGSVGPAGNFADFSIFGKLFLSFIMLVGRLEINTILILFTPGFWKI